MLLRSVWGLIMLACMFYVMATLTTFSLPDTLTISKAKSQQDTASDDDSADATSANGTSSIFQETLRQAREGFREIRLFLRGNGLVVIMMLCYVFVALSKVVQIMLLQYTTKRFNWSWSKVSLITTYH